MTRVTEMEPKQSAIRDKMQFADIVYFQKNGEVFTVGVWKTTFQVYINSMDSLEKCLKAVREVY